MEKMQHSLLNIRMCDLQQISDSVPHVVVENALTESRCAWIQAVTADAV